MLLSAVVAMASNRVMGDCNRLPWPLPADLRRFKQITLGKPIIMGRKTFQSIGRPLPDRLNIIVTRDSQFNAPGCVVVFSPMAALEQAKKYEEVCVIGGSELYQQCLPYVERIYLTLIHHTFEGDTFFPELNQQEWRECSREDCLPDASNKYAYSFIVLERVK